MRHRLPHQHSPERSAGHCGMRRDALRPQPHIIPWGSPENPVRGWLRLAVQHASPVLLTLICCYGCQTGPASQEFMGVKVHASLRVIIPEQDWRTPFFVHGDRQLAEIKFTNGERGQRQLLSLQQYGLPGDDSIARVRLCGESAFVLGWDGALSCVQRVTGVLRWRRGADQEEKLGAISFPTAKTVLLWGRQTILAIDVTDGSTLWKAKIGDCVEGATEWAVPSFSGVLMPAEIPLIVYSAKSGNLFVVELDSCTGELSCCTSMGSVLKLAPGDPEALADLQEHLSHADSPGIWGTFRDGNLAFGVGRVLMLYRPESRTLTFKASLTPPLRVLLSKKACVFSDGNGLRAVDLRSGDVLWQTRPPRWTGGGSLGTDGAHVYVVYLSFGLMGKDNYYIASFSPDDGALLGTARLPGVPLLIGGNGRSLVVGVWGKDAKSLRLHQVRLRGR